MTPTDTAALLLSAARIGAPPILLSQVVRACPMPVHMRIKPLDRPACSFWSAGELHVIVNEADPWERQRFSAAHELGHHICGGTTSERTANAIATNVLMPAEMVRQELRYYRTVRELSDRFKVTATAMEYRLLELGVGKLRRVPWAG